MRIEQMRQLLEIAKSKSLNIACQNMHITQQALSSSVKKMETELNVKLLHRNAHGVSLTEEGRYFAEGFNKILMEYDILLHNNSNGHRIENNELNIAVSFGCIEAFLGEIISEYLNKEKICTIHVAEDDYNKSVQDLLNDKVQMMVINYSTFNSDIISLETDIPLPDEIVTIPLFSSPLYIKVSKKSPLAKMHSISLSTLENEKILIYDNKNWTFNYMKDIFAQLNCDLNFKLEENYQLHANMIRNNLGISFGILGGKFYQHENGIKYIEVDLPIFVQGVCFIKKENLNIPQIQHFVNYLQISCAQ